MITLPKERASMFQMLFEHAVIDDDELYKFALKQTDADLPQLKAEYLLKVERILEEYISDDTKDDIRNLIRPHPVQVRYLIFLRYLEARFRLSFEDQSPRQFADSFEEQIREELLNKSEDYVNWITVLY